MDKFLKHIRRQILILAYCALSSCLVADLFASSLKSNEVSTITKVNSMIKQYSQQFNRLPQSWDEMIRDGMLAEPILGYARNVINLESRYRFPESNSGIVIGSRKEKVIAMAIHSGLEGDNADHPDVSLRAGRWLFVIMPSGEIATRRYSELVLGQLFEAAGFRLEDYTGSDGKWLPGDRSSQQGVRNQAAEEIGLGEIELAETGPNVSPTPGESLTVGKPEGSTGIGNQEFWCWVLVGIVSLSLLPWFFRKMSSRS
jgi:hypothetical protein